MNGCKYSVWKSLSIHMCSCAIMCLLISRCAYIKHFESVFESGRTAGASQHVSNSKGGIEIILRAQQENT